MLPSAKGLSFTFMLSQPIPLYLKQALSCYVSLIHMLIHLIMFTKFFWLVQCFCLKEYIFESFSMNIKSLFCWAYGFCYVSSILEGSAQKKE
jgi:hypothetical protein